MERISQNIESGKVCDRFRSKYIREKADGLNALLVLGESSRLVISSITAVSQGVCSLSFECFFGEIGNIEKILKSWEDMDLIAIDIEGDLFGTTILVGIDFNDMDIRIQYDDESDFDAHAYIDQMELLLKGGM